MSTIMTNWDRAELEAYILIFCAIADFVETEEEKTYILSHVDRASYERMHKEFEEDNDYESIQKIMSTLIKLDINGEEREELVKEMQELMMSDGRLDIMEENMLRLLKRLV